MDIMRLGIQNFRGFRERGSIELKPINILVGKNSSGKSSIARLFPLLRQSFETKTKGPILWFGQYVDFGSFADSITKSSNDDSIQISLDVALESNNRRGRLPNFTFTGNRSLVMMLEDAVAKVKIDLSYSSETKSTYTSGFSIEIFGNRLIATIDQYGWVQTIVVNNETIQLPEDMRCYSIGSDLISSISFIKDKNYKKDIDEKDWEFLNSFGENLLVNFIRSHTHGNLTKKKLMSFVNSIGFGSDAELLEKAKKFSSSSSYLNDFSISLKSRTYKFNKLPRQKNSWVVFGTGNAPSA